MKSFFSMLLLIIFCIVVCKIYLGSKDVQTSVDKAGIAAKSGVKQILKKSADAL